MHLLVVVHSVSSYLLALVLLGLLWPSHHMVYCGPSHNSAYGGHQVSLSITGYKARLSGPLHITAYWSLPITLSISSTYGHADMALFLFLGERFSLWLPADIWCSLKRVQEFSLQNVMYLCKHSLLVAVRTLILPLSFNLTNGLSNTMQRFRIPVILHRAAMYMILLI